MITFSDNFKTYVLPLISLSVTLYITWYIYKNILCALHDKIKIRRIIHKKQKEKEHAFQKLEARYKLDPKSEEILQLSPSELLIQLKKRKLSATQALEAHIAKALQETKLYNNVTEFIPQAHIWAAHLDEMSEVSGPFHGLPISVKDNCQIEGMDSTLGFGKNLHHPEIENAAVIKSLMDLGCVPFVKTNVPQSLFCWGCGNPIFGETKNPLNPLLSPGGSSGGEASLIASGGSLLGIGTDVGGSCRIPAHFCGLSGFKPTKMRLSPTGFKSIVSGLVGISGVPGIISKSVDLIASIFKELTMPGVQTKHDKLTVPINWDEKTFTSAKPLRIGYFTSLQYFPVMGDTEKVVLDAKTALEAERHVLVPFEMGSGFEIAELLANLAYADDGCNSRQIWKDEPVAQSAIFHYLMIRIPTCLRKLLAYFMTSQCLPFAGFFHSPRVAAFFRGGATQSRDLWACMEKRRQLVQDFSSQWHRLNLDLLLCPAFPFAAVPAKAAGKLKPACVYTMLFNLLDFPAGVVNFGSESGTNLDSYQDEDDFLLKTAQKAAKHSVGMPIAVQLVGLPFQEEIVLRVMKELESLRSIKQ